MTCPCLTICLPEIPAVSHVCSLQVPLETLLTHPSRHPCSHPNTCCVFPGMWLGHLNIGDLFHISRDTGWWQECTPHLDHGVWGVCTVLRVGLNVIMKACRCWCEQGDKRLTVPARKGRGRVEDGDIFNGLQKTQEVTRWTGAPEGILSPSFSQERKLWHPHGFPRCSHPGVTGENTQFPELGGSTAWTPLGPIKPLSAALKKFSSTAQGVC